MKKSSLFTSLMALLLLFVLFTSCNSDSKTTEETTNMDTPMPDTMAIVDESMNDTFGYSYNYVEDDMAVPEATKSTEKRLRMPRQPHQN